MQPDPFAPQQQTVIVGQTSAVPVAQMDPYGNPVVYLPQERSSGAKVLGVLCIIGGVFSIIGILGSFLPQTDMDGNIIEVPMIAMLLSALGSAVMAGTFIVGGVWLLDYKRRGVHLCWVGLILGSVMAIASYAAGGDGGMGSYFGEETGFMIAFVTTLLCNGICGLIVAIPMMSATGGLDDSSLF
ncbi:MAG: hypothetical protein VX627_00740 [Candidatus Thermoplasmatota archaeon]|nr:hypothetical protein [Candidatus Thermoplasmatota archaeon]